MAASTQFPRPLSFLSCKAICQFGRHMRFKQRATATSPTQTIAKPRKGLRAKILLRDVDLPQPTWGWKAYPYGANRDNYTITAVLGRLRVWV